MDEKKFKKLMPKKKFETVKVEASDLHELVLKQHNNLISAKFNLTAMQEKVLYGVFGLWQNLPKYKSKNKIVIPSSEIFNITGIPPSNINHFKDIMSTLMGKIGMIKDLSTGKELRFTFFSAALYSEGYVVVEFPSMLLPYISNFHSTGHYTEMKIKEIAHLNSQYSIRIYQFLLQYYKTRTKIRFFDLEELKKLLLFEEYNTKHSLYGDFKKYVLDIAKNEINKNTFIRYDYKEIKTSRKVTGIEFIIEIPEIEDNPIPELLSKPEKESYIFNIMTNYNFTVEEIQEIAKTNSVDLVFYNLLYSLDMEQKHQGKENEILNMKAYIKKAISQNYSKF